MSQGGLFAGEAIATAKFRFMTGQKISHIDGLEKRLFHVYTTVAT
jgi:hypothetical protein